MSSATKEMAANFRQMAEASNQMVEDFAAHDNMAIAGALMTTVLVYNRIAESFERAAAVQAGVAAKRAVEERETPNERRNGRSPVPQSLLDLLSSLER